MLLPKKVKFRKWQTGRANPKNISADTRGTKLSFGSYGLKAESQARVESKQIESARKVISRTLTKAGKLWIRIFPDRPFTAKAAEVGMGKGKGDPQDIVLMFFPDVLFLKWTEWRKAWLGKRCAKPGANCRLKLGLFPESTKIILVPL